MGSFTTKSIEIKFTLSHGVFAGTSSNSVTLSGLRVHAEIEKGGFPTKCSAKAKIYGMAQDLISQLTVLTFNAVSARRNLIEIRAGDSDGLSTVFIGEITGAWANYAAPPELYFEVQALAGFHASVAPGPPSSMPGAVRVADVMRSLARQMGYTFEDKGVGVMVANPYLSGPLYTQAESLAKMAGIEFGVDDGVLFIAPKGEARPTRAIPVLTPRTGLREYPVADNRLMTFKALFSPYVTFGGLAEVRESDIPQANGLWRVLGIKHKLSSRSPQQSTWFSELICVKAGS